MEAITLRFQVILEQRVFPQRLRQCSRRNQVKLSSNLGTVRPSPTSVAIFKTKQSETLPTDTPRTLYLERQADGDQDDSRVVVRVVVALQDVPQLVGVGREEGQVHHPLGDGLLVLVDVDVRHGFGHDAAEFRAEFERHPPLHAVGNHATQIRRVRQTVAGGVGGYAVGSGPVQQLQGVGIVLGFLEVEDLVDGGLDLARVVVELVFGDFYQRRADVRMWHVVVEFFVLAGVCHSGVGVSTRELRVGFANFRGNYTAHK